MSKEKIYTPHLCEDGCGKITKQNRDGSYNRFIHGHNGKSTGTDIGTLMKGKPSSMKGKHHTEEAKEKIREGHIGLEPWNKGKEMWSEEDKKNMSKQRKGKDAWNKGIKMDLTPEQRKKYSENAVKKNTGRKDSPETIEKRRQSFLKRWEDPEFAHKMHLSWKRQFNKTEKTLFDILQTISTDWKFVGDGTVTIGRKSPDFINGKKIIELFGNWWHEDNEVEERTEYFKSFGYDTLIIWESELKDENILEKIKKFTEVKE